jgi:hypothetical protein
MKKVIVLLVAAVFSVTTGFAQEREKEKDKPKPQTEKAPKTPEERANACADRMSKDLGLSADQIMKIHDLALTRAKKMDELREKYKGKDGDKQLWKEERKKVRDEFHAGVKAVLSPEQYAKWEEQKKKKESKPGKGNGKGKGKKGEGQGPAPTPVDEKDKDIDLDGGE